MNEVEFFNETGIEVPELEEVKKVIDYAIQYEKLDHVEFNVILVDNTYIHQLNLTYRHIDRPTDVITFALEDVKDIEIKGNRVLGDIYISLDKAKEQAKEYGHSFLRELSFLAVHGFLHLLGYDHMTQEEETLMFGRQEDILSGYGIRKTNN